MTLPPGNFLAAVESMPESVAGEEVSEEWVVGGKGARVYRCLRCWCRALLGGNSGHVRLFGRLPGGLGLRILLTWC